MSCKKGKCHDLYDHELWGILCTYSSAIAKVEFYPFSRDKSSNTMPSNNETFAETEKVKQKILTRNGSKVQHTCAQCKKVFVSAGRLKSHMHTHTGEKPHSCAECGKSFCEAGNLKKHMIIHSSQMPYMCTSWIIQPPRFKIWNITLQLTLNKSQINARNVIFGRSHKPIWRDTFSPTLGKSHINAHGVRAHSGKQELWRNTFVFTLEKSLINARIATLKPCNICQYSAMRKVSLTKHLRSVHSE